ncbi:hypothetical protein B0H15DRAFT_958524 [Mycena belliarum]|uniref:Uncharacterized protein n=1 Tax=Mycena belliarum TaxID=1033014 RepID=A0AAD6TKE3_9AGAR|nr:hypothetical protein B0H15DRAFT_958524 [Mycena belliae]
MSETSSESGLSSPATPPMSAEECARQNVAIALKRIEECEGKVNSLKQRLTRARSGNQKEMRDLADEALAQAKAAYDQAEAVLATFVVKPVPVLDLQKRLDLVAQTVVLDDTDTSKVGQGQRIGLDEGSHKEINTPLALEEQDEQMGDPIPSSRPVSPPKDFDMELGEVIEIIDSDNGMDIVHGPQQLKLVVEALDELNKGMDKVIPEGDDEGMNLDDNDFIATKLKQKKKKPAGLQDPSLKDLTKQAIEAAITLSAQKHAEVHQALEKMRSKNEKAKRKNKGKGKEKSVPEQSDDEKSEPEAKEDEESHDAMVRWTDSADDDDKERLREKGEKALDAFISNGTNIPFDLRRLMKLVPEFLPRCASISREVTLHILTNRAKKNPCVFHTLKTSGRKAVSDGNGKFVVNGVPYGKGTAEGNFSKGALSCGCQIDEALLDFMLYKLAEARSYHPSLTAVEDLGGDPFHPRPRTFLSQVFLQTGLTINHLFVGEDNVFAALPHTLFLLDRVVQKINLFLPEGEQKVVVSRV